MIRPTELADIRARRNVFSIALHQRDGEEICFFHFCEVARLGAFKLYHETFNAIEAVPIGSVSARHARSAFCKHWRDALQCLLRDSSLNYNGGRTIHFKCTCEIHPRRGLGSIPLASHSGDKSESFSG